MHKPEDTLQRRAVDGRLQDGGGSGELGGPKTDATHLDMIRVTVSARGVVDGENVRGLLPQQRRQPLGRLVEVRAGERLSAPGLAVHA